MPIIFIVFNTHASNDSVALQCRGFKDASKDMDIDQELRMYIPSNNRQLNFFVNLQFNNDV